MKKGLSGKLVRQALFRDLLSFSSGAFPMISVNCRIVFYVSILIFVA
jgi:hypothetical protein